MPKTERRPCAACAPWRGVLAACLSPLSRGAVLVVIGCIRLYQLTLSPVLGTNCRYHPSCSAYAVQAIQTHGLPRGLFLAFKRIVRCHPWSEGGFDPVPPAVHPLPSLQEYPGRHGRE